MRVTGISSLRLRTLALVLLAVVPALILAVSTAREQREMESRRVREDMLRIARLVASDSDGTVDAARQFLAAVAQIPEIRKRDSLKAETILTDLREKNGFYEEIGATDLEGRVFANTGLPPPDSMRDDWRRAIQTRRFAVGYTTGGGRDTALNFAVPFHDEKGAVAGVVFATLKLDWRREFVRWELPPGSMMTVVDRSGRVVLRYPESEGFTGQALRNEPIVREMLRRPEGAVEAVGLDKVTRLYGFSTLRGALESNGLVVGVGVPRKAVFQPLEVAFRRNLLLLAVVALLAMLAAWIGGDWFFLRQVRAMVTASERLSEGDLSSRTGLHYGNDELSQLARSFDEMGASLEHLSGHYELILRSVGDGIYVVNREGYMSVVNPAAARILGCGPLALIGAHHHEIGIGERFSYAGTGPAEGCPICQVSQSQEGSRSDADTIKRRDGASVPVEYIVTPAVERGEVVGAVITFRDISERLNAQKEIDRAHEEIVSVLAEKRRFYRDVIKSVTRDRLRLVERDEIPNEGEQVLDLPLNTAVDDRNLRHKLVGMAEEYGFSHDVVGHLVLAAGEASTNAVKHATDGRGQVFLTKDRFIVRISDKGHGIPADDLPRSLFQPGFSTKVSLGMGYTLMLELVDRVWLATGVEGTTVQLEKWLHPEEHEDPILKEAFERF
jgi:PAS domain S-box-containing protein